MPHIHIEYSRNLEGSIDFANLCESLRLEAIKIEAFPMAGIRVRACGVDHYAIADGNPKHGYVDIQVRIREGRSQAVKRDAIQRIFDRARQELQTPMACLPIALSAELRDINADLSPKFGTIRDHLEDTA